MEVPNDAAARSLDETNQAVQHYLANNSSTKARREAIAAAKALVIELQTGEDAHWQQYESIASAYMLRTVLSMGIMSGMPSTLR